MKIKHAEYSIHVLAPFNRQQCMYGADSNYPVACQNDGDFTLIIRDDNDVVRTRYRNICGPHLLLRVIDWIAGN